MKYLILPLLVFSSLAAASDFPGQFSGEVTAEYRYFPTEGDYGNTDQHHSSVMIQPTYTLSWENDRNVITFVPFARFDRLDDERTHFDIRELSIVASWSWLELRAGISKVFWGVTESQHLVDVINQTDLIENPDGEKKLGQPMINPVLVTPVGNLEFFVLPYFRERTFPGEHGRYRGPYLIDTDNAEYTEDAQDRHTDYALRWSTNWRGLEWAASYFSGTDREPGFRFDLVSGKLVPVYHQARQWGLEILHVYEDLITKAELLHKDSEIDDPFLAATTGFEYTLANIAHGMDIGLLYEWLYDSREEAAPSGMYDASFYGTRLALNDTASTQVLMGAIYSNDSPDLIVYRVEASRRLAEFLSLGLEVNIIGRPPEESRLYPVRSDDYFQVTLSGYY